MWISNCSKAVFSKDGPFSTEFFSYLCQKSIDCIHMDLFLTCFVTDPLLSWLHNTVSFKQILSFIYYLHFWLHWVFIAAPAFSLCSEWWLLSLGVRVLLMRWLLVAEHSSRALGPSCPTAWEQQCLVTVYLKVSKLGSFSNFALLFQSCFGHSWSFAFPN